MGGIKSSEESAFEGGSPGKIDASLNERLQNVEWGEYKFKEVFNRIKQGRRLKRNNQLPGDIPFVMSGVTNSGVVNYVSNPISVFPENSITIDIFGNTFYREYRFGAGDDTGVYWNDNIRYSRGTMLFFAAAMERTLRGKFSYGKKLRSSQSLDFKMKLPSKNGKIDFEFMESFVAELEAQRVAELEAYLLVTGLKDTKLSFEEEQVLSDFDKIQWGKFNLEKLFGKSTRGKRLKSADRLKGVLPFVTAGEADEGISDFIGNEVQFFSENTTTVDMFGSAKYRNYKYGGDDHIAVVHTEDLPKYAAIFLTTAIHKSSHNGQFDYGRNFYAKDADSLNVLLPATGNEPDYDTMSTLISAIHKIVIRDVVAYADRKIAATKDVVTTFNHTTAQNKPRLYRIKNEPARMVADGEQKYNSTEK